MEQKIIFRQLLDELKELAAGQGNTITTKQADKCLAHAGLSKDQLELVYAYLTEQKIRVEGYAGAKDTAKAAAENTGGDTSGPEAAGEDHEEAASLKDEAGEALSIYLEELEALGEMDPVLEEELFHKAAAGDKAARDALTEAYLPMVCDLAGEMENEQMPAEDLIQEGNMGLILALDALEKRSSLAAYQAQVMNAVGTAMHNAMQLNQEISAKDEEMAGKVNRLHEAILELKEELGEDVTESELSAYLNKPLQEIRDILQLAGDELKKRE